MDRGKIAELYRTWGPAIYRRCLRLLRDTEAARDATQEVFRKALSSPEKLVSADPKSGVILTISSLAAYEIYPYVTYKATKAAMIAFTQQVAIQNASYGIRANCILPGLMDTPMAVDTRVGVLVDGMEHEEVADALGISRKTVSRKLARFLENARKYLERSAA